MKKILTSVWFWLMIISITLIGFFILQLVDKCLIVLFEKEIFWVAISSFGTLLSVVVAVGTYIHNEAIRKKQATFDAYNEFKNEVFDFENQIQSIDLHEVLEQKKKIDNNELPKDTCKEWDNVKKYLAKTERIATCINNSIFDIEAIYNMGGPYMIDMYEKLEDIILYKRTSESREGIYKEFEVMVKKLKKMN